MPEHICVAYEDAERSDAALEQGVDLALSTGARLTVAHVVAPGDEPVDAGTSLGDALIGLDGHEFLRGRLRDRVADLAPDAVPAIAVLEGRVGDALHTLVRRERIDLLVVGRGRRDLLTRAPCAVLVVGRSVSDVVSPRRSPSLLWQLFVAHAAVLVLALAALVLAPVRVSATVVATEVLILTGGLAFLLVLHLVLLRRALAPLRLLTDVVGTIDADHPGRRLPVPAARSAEVADLAEAFNGVLDRLEDERRRSRRRALAAQEDERRRIARELHDQVGQTLTALTIQAERAAEDPRAADQIALRQLADTAQGSVEDVRRLVRGLRPEALDDLGLGNAVLALCRRLSNQSGIRIAPDLPQALPQLRPEVELVVYRIAQEAITNALRHAEAEEVRLGLRADARELELTVRDNGTGIGSEVVAGSGLEGMRERAALVGGTLELRATAGSGTLARLTIPRAEAVVS